MRTLKMTNARVGSAITITEAAAFAGRRRFVTVSSTMPPPTDEPPREKSLEEVVQKLGLYPIDAFVFVQQGLAYTVKKLHGDAAKEMPKETRHISGQDLCEGLRDLALRRWGMMARAVFSRWGITSTLDFGRIVFAMI